MSGSRLEHHRGGAGEPLLLAHGIGSSWRAWRHLLPSLEQRHDVLAVDLPGFGGSPPLPSGTRPTVPNLATAVEAELDRVGWATAHIAGNSLGGWLALELARRGRARSVVALSPAGMWTPREGAYSRAILRLAYAGTRLIGRRAGLVTRSPFVRTLLFPIVSGRPWRMDPADACDAVEGLAGADAFPETLEATIDPVAEALDEVDVPTLIAWGSHDLLLPPRQARRFVRAIPGAELRVLSGLGHVPMWDDAELVANAIIEFTARASTGQPARGGHGASAGAVAASTGRLGGR